MLRCLGGNSPFLADMALREAASLCLFARSGPEAAPVSYTHLTLPTKA